MRGARHDDRPSGPSQRVRAAPVACILAFGLLHTPAAGIVIRHDRPDAAYLASADDFPSLVLTHGAHGTLIASSWVLTAAHVAHRLKPGHRVTIAGKDIAVRDVHLHPGWRTPQTNIVDDMALLELSEPAAGIEPTAIYRRRDEAGRVMTFAGRGGTGNGRDGLARFQRPYGLLRKATNRVERTDERWLVFHFDPPGTGTELEGISGPGDSGGPAFLDVEGRRFLAGVSAWQDNRSQGRAGVYGVIEYYARVSSYAEWIDSVVGRASEAEARSQDRDGGPGRNSGPALEAVRFLPGLVSTPETIEHGATATADGRELWFTRAVGTWGKPVERQTIYVARRSGNGRFRPPEPAPFSGEHSDRDWLQFWTGRAVLACRAYAEGVTPNVRRKAAVKWL